MTKKVTTSATTTGDQDLQQIDGKTLKTTLNFV